MPRNHASTLILAGIGIATLSACSDWNNRSAANNPPSGGTQYAAATMPARHELTPDMVRQVQQGLQQQGLYNGAVDGVWGPATQASLKTYQQSHGLDASGQIDSKTLTALNLPADNAPPANAQPDPSQQPNNQPTDNNPPAQSSQSPP